MRKAGNTTIGTQVPDELKETFAERARSNGLTLSEYIRAGLWVLESRPDLLKLGVEIDEEYKRKKLGSSRHYDLVLFLFVFFEFCIFQNHVL